MLDEQLKERKELLDKKAKIVEGTEGVEAKQDKSGETAERRIKRRRRKRQEEEEEDASKERRRRDSPRKRRRSPRKEQTKMTS